MAPTQHRLRSRDGHQLGGAKPGRLHAGEGLIEEGIGMPRTVSPCLALRGKDENKREEVKPWVDGHGGDTARGDRRRRRWVAQGILCSHVKGQQLSR